MSDQSAARAMRVLLDEGGAIGTTEPDYEVFEVVSSQDGDGRLWVGVDDRSNMSDELLDAARVLVADWLGRRDGRAENGRGK